MNQRRLFVASCIALVATAMTFAVRGDIMGNLGQDFSLNKEQVGYIAGAAFWGFTISIFIGGQLCDWLGMSKLLALAFLCHMAGILLTIFAPGFWLLWTATLIIGLGNGLIEAAANPLVATIYPDDKTNKLNALHVWFPGGIVIGGLAAYALSQGKFDWKIKMATILVPTVIYGVMFLGQKFPATERVQAGVSTGDMFKEALRPMFLLLIFCMLLTASTELGPNQWIPNIMAKTLPDAASAGILVLVWINGLMAIGRWFAGPIVHRLSPIGVLIGSAVFSAAGLFWLSGVQTATTAFAAATVFAIGICYFWPTMLGVTSERFPKGGAFLLGLMGAAGNLSVALVLPIMGRIYDQNVASMGEQLGASQTLLSVTILPIILIVIFGAMFLRDRAAGGYKAVRLSQSS
ncbi:MAG: MFS transporter [Acidobacteria bacterium]|nr:MFS transporter [Acidobacteriota bacterium]